MIKKIRKIEVYSYTVPLITPLQIKGVFIQQRNGLICLIHYENQTVGMGEISPLTPLSQESFQEAKDQLISACDLLKKQQDLDLKNLFPSVAFGLRCALVLTADIAPFSVKFSGLFYHDYLLENVTMKTDTYKIKVSHLSLNEAIQKVRQFKDLYPKIKLRLDANQKWSFSEALQFLKHFKSKDFEYIEEPCKNKNDLLQLLLHVNFPIALDESILNFSEEEIVNTPNIKALIIKPSLIDYQKWINIKPIVFSSLIETGVGIALIGHLSKHNSHFSAGVDTYKYLKEDILIKPLVFSENLLKVETISLNYRKLKLCYLV